MVWVRMSEEFDAFGEVNVLCATDVSGLEFVIRQELNGSDVVVNVNCIIIEEGA